ncbi:recombinase family protein [Arthrobacter sp. 4R501]|uniref:recombinase family protein n=1 Tax=Arthrobacter sp. 4R501 TaxID=2058886 RepID=UPI000CE53D52|nr:recombinase family protein [Arthrobacter sp. 4R501]
MSTTPLRAAIYARISKDREGAGLGVQRQEQDCREVAQRMGWQVARVFVDNDISAFSGKARPAYKQLLEAMAAGSVQTVICWHTDRLHRSPRELEDYIEISESRGITTQTVKAGDLDLSTPSGRANARSLGVWARYESEHKSERIIRKKVELAQAGKFSGGPVPYGWRIEKKSETPAIVQEDAAEIRKAIAAIIAGASIGSIVKDLNGRGVPTRRGQTWTSTSVRNLLLRPTNAGLTAYKGEIMKEKSTFPAIITEDEWRTVKAIVTNPARRSQTDSRVRHLLAGLLRCGTCGAAMKTSSRAGGAGESKFYYKCPTTGTGHAFQTAEPVEHLITETVLARLSDASVLARLNGPDDQRVQQSLQSEASVLRGRMDEAAESFADGLITRKQLEAINARVGGRLDVIEQELASAARSSVVPVSAGRNLRGWWDDADIERRRAVINALLVPVVQPIRKSAPRLFDPSRVRIEWKAA